MGTIGANVTLTAMHYDNVGSNHQNYIQSMHASVVQITQLCEILAPTIYYHA